VSRKPYIQRTLRAIEGLSGEEARGVVRKLGVVTPWEGVETPWPCGASKHSTVPNNNDHHHQHNVYSAVIMTQSHCQSSPGSCDECRTAPMAAHPWTKLMNLSHWPACKLLGNCIHHCHLLLLSPKADTDFTIPQKVEG